MELAPLLTCIDEIDRISNQTWLDSLDDRKRAELDFHNRDRDRKATVALDQDTYEKFYANKKYYNTVGLSHQYVEAWVRQHAPGKVFLDYACGNGTRAIEAAQAGAALSLGLDISDVSVRNAQADARAMGLGNIRFFQADAENTRLPDSSVDVIICSGMLHHLDLSYSFPELRRILAPGGRILAVEALDYNPAIKLYRKLTPAMRTEWESSHILGLQDVAFASRFFDLGELRYWHVTSYAAGRFPALLGVLNALDGLLTRVPWIQRLAWIFTFELRSKK
jgi:ubiquinone/menaquinone biosynthesis C-methylase UbiE